MSREKQYSIRFESRTGILPSSIYYGWVVVGSSLFITISAYGCGFTLGVYLNPLKQAFAASTASITAPYSLCLLIYTCMAFFSGWCVDKHGPRVTTTIGGALLCAGLILTSQITAIWHLYITYGLIGAGMSTAYSPVVTTVSHWFVQRRGLALGIASAGTGAGPFLVAPLIQYLISTYNWRAAFLVTGIGVALIFPAGLLLVKCPPSTSTGRNEPVPNPLLKSSGRGRPDANIPVQRSLSLTEAVRTRAFLLISFIFFMVGVGDQMLIAHIVAYCQVIGMSPLLSAIIISVIGASNIFGRVASGWISDKLERKKVLGACVFLEGATILGISLTTSTGMLFLFAIVFGIGYGGHSTQFPAIMGDTFGLRSMGVILGAAVFFWGLGAAVGPYLAGYVFDATSSYTNAFSFGAAGLLVSAIVSQLIKKPVVDP